MKTKDFDGFARQNTRPALHRRRGADGPNIRNALLGVVCVVGVFGVLTLLFHLG